MEFFDLPVSFNSLLTLLIVLLHCAKSNMLLTSPRWSQIHYWLRCSFPVWKDWTAKRTHKGVVLQRVHRAARLSVLVGLFAGLAWLRRNPHKGSQILQALQVGKELLLSRVKELASR